MSGPPTLAPGTLQGVPVARVTDAGSSPRGPLPLREGEAGRVLIRHKEQALCGLLVLCS